MARIIEALDDNGVFVGQFFGTNDGWNLPNSSLSFFTRAEVEQLLAPLELIKLEEEDSDGVLANGDKKHWHVFDVIAQKQKALNPLPPAGGRPYGLSSATDDGSVGRSGAPPL